MVRDKNGIGLYYSFLERRPTFCKAGKLDFERMESLLVTINNQKKRVLEEFPEVKMGLTLGSYFVANAFFVGFGSDDDKYIEGVLKDTFDNVGIPYMVEGNYKILEKSLKPYKKKTKGVISGLLDRNRIVVDI